MDYAKMPCGRLNGGCGPLGAVYANPKDGPSLFTLALASAAVIAAIELPISQYYSTVPESRTPTRMTVAAGMAFVAVLVAGAALKFNKPKE